LILSSSFFPSDLLHTSFPLKFCAHFSSPMSYVSASLILLDIFWRRVQILKQPRVWKHFNIVTGGSSGYAKMCAILTVHLFVRYCNMITSCLRILLRYCKIMYFSDISIIIIC
jgi:hypothetical protein